MSPTGGAAPILGGRRGTSGRAPLYKGGVIARPRPSDLPPPEGQYHR